MPDRCAPPRLGGVRSRAPGGRGSWAPSSGPRPCPRAGPAHAPAQPPPPRSRSPGPGAARSRPPCPFCRHGFWHMNGLELLLREGFSDDCRGAGDGQPAWCFRLLPDRRRVDELTPSQSEFALCCIPDFSLRSVVSSGAHSPNLRFRSHGTNFGMPPPVLELYSPRLSSSSPPPPLFRTRALSGSLCRASSALRFLTSLHTC